MNEASPQSPNMTISQADVPMRLYKLVAIISAKKYQDDVSFDVMPMLNVKMLNPQWRNNRDLSDELDLFCELQRIIVRITFYLW